MFRARASNPTRKGFNAERHGLSLSRSSGERVGVRGSRPFSFAGRPRTSTALTGAPVRRLRECAVALCRVLQDHTVSFLSPKLPILWLLAFLIARDFTLL